MSAVVWLGDYIRSFIQSIIWLMLTRYTVIQNCSNNLLQSAPICVGFGSQRLPIFRGLGLDFPATGSPTTHDRWNTRSTSDHLPYMSKADSLSDRRTKNDKAKNTFSPHFHLTTFKFPEFSRISQRVAPLWTHPSSDTDFSICSTELFSSAERILSRRHFCNYLWLKGRKGKEEYLYTAILTDTTLTKRSDMDHSLPANYTMSAFPS